ncbi:Syntaxin-72, partial [Bienertia sinuspersici]
IKEVVGNEKLKKYEVLKRLHKKEIEKHREDTLSVKDAYMERFKKLKDNATVREASLASEIETLKASNLKATVSRINIEAIKREKNLGDDMMKLFKQM